MKKETVTLLSIGIIVSTLISSTLLKKKPQITSLVLGSFGAFGLIHNLVRGVES